MIKFNLIKNKKSFLNKRNGGQAIFASVIYLIVMSFPIIFGLISPSVREYKTSNVNLNSKKSYYLAESGIEDAIYRVKLNKDIDELEELIIGEQTSTTNIIKNSSKVEIKTNANVLEHIRSLSVNLITSVGAGFNQGVLAGAGGFVLDGGSNIWGNVYSNGKISATDGAKISGTAISADSVPFSLSESNENPSTPTSSISFRNVPSSQDFAQSFILEETIKVNKIQLYIKKVGNPPDATIRIVGDNGGSPNTTSIATGTLKESSISSNYNWVDLIFSSNPVLNANTIYWIVVDNSNQNINKYFVIGSNADTSYIKGTSKTGVYNGTWNTTNLDSYFRIYTGGFNSFIGGASWIGGVKVGTNGLGDAWAVNVMGAKVEGDLYCINGSSNNQTCDTSKGTPPPEEMPFTSENILDWKNNAEKGGIITGATKCPGGYSNGNCIVNWKGATFGPGKITGNLIVNGGGTLTLTGTLWVQGTITLTDGGKIKLPAGYGLNSETIISDNFVDISGGSSLGSGSEGSYLFIVSTSNSENAIKVSSGAGAIAVCAQDGGVKLEGGASLYSAVGKKVSAIGGTNVYYKEGLANPSFVNGPSGIWNIENWTEVGSE